MQLMCPVCNGLADFDQHCPNCGKALRDEGPIQQFYGPYSAYRPIDDIKKSNGFPDLANNECMHLAYCANCNQQLYAAVSELSL